MAGERLGSAVLELRTDQGPYDQGMQRAHTSAKNLDKSFGGLKETSTKLFSALKGVAAAYIGIQGIRKAVGFVQDATKSFEAQEDALVRLAVAVRENPVLDGSAFQRLAALGGEIQKVSIFGDEQVQQALAFASAAGLAEQQVARIGKVAADVASAGIMDYGSAVEQLTRTFTGMAGTLGRTIPGINALTKAELENGAAVELVAKHYKGMAEAIGDTVSGVHTRTGNLIGDIKETIGGIFGQLRRNLELQLIPVLEGLNEWFTKNAPKIYAVFAKLPQVLRVVGETGIEIMKKMFSLETLGDLLANLGKGLVAAIGEAFKGIFKGWQALIAGFLDTAKEFGSKFWLYFLQGLVNNMTSLPRKALGFVGRLLNLEGMAELEETLKVKIVDADTGRAIGERVSASLGAAAGAAGGGIIGSLKALGAAALDATKVLGPVMEEAGRKLEPIIAEGAAEFSKYNAKIEGLANATDQLTAQVIRGTAELTAFNSAAEIAQTPTGNYYPGAPVPEMDAALMGGGGAKDISRLGWILQDVGQGIGSFASGLWGAAQSITSLKLILDPLSTIFQSFAATLAPVVDKVLAPVVGALSVLGQALAKILAPAIIALSPIIEKLAQAFVWLYNNVLRPVGNMISTLFQVLATILTAVANAFIGIANLFLAKKDEIKYLKAPTINSNALSEISYERLSASGDAAISTGASMGASASYQQARPISVTIDVHDNTIAGDGSFRDLALTLKNEFASLGVLGMA